MQEIEEWEVKRGQVYYANLDPVVGSEQGAMCRWHMFGTDRSGA